MTKNNNEFISYQGFSSKLKSDYKKINNNNRNFISYQDFPSKTEESNLETLNTDSTDSEDPKEKRKSFQGKPIEIEPKKISIDFEQTLSLQKLAQICHIAFSIFPPSDLQKFLPHSDLQKILSFFDAISNDAKNVNRTPLVPGAGFSDKPTTKENKEETAENFKKAVKNLLEEIIPRYKAEKPYKRFLQNDKKNSGNTNKGR